MVSVMGDRAEVIELAGATAAPADGAQLLAGSVELPDRVVLRVIGLDGLGDVVDRLTIAVVVHEAREDVVDDLSAANLVGVGGDERVLRLSTVRGDDRGAVARWRVTARVSSRREVW